jgi:hypothetical protein
MPPSTETPRRARCGATSARSPRSASTRATPRRAPAAAAGPSRSPPWWGQRERNDGSEREKSAEEWDASPTQNLTGEELADRMTDDGDRKTAFAVPAAAPVAVAASLPPPTRAPQSTVHDPEIQTSQAVRVVVWRDGNGVHIAPAGTVVSSITIDAVLVVLEPTADLTAWLSQRER